MTASIEHIIENIELNVAASNVLPMPTRVELSVVDDVVDDFTIDDVVVVRRVPRPSLSKREVEVLLAWLGTESKRDAAEALFISPATVSTHVSRIRDKYAEIGRPAPTKAHLLIRALQDGFTAIEDW